MGQLPGHEEALGKAGSALSQARLALHTQCVWVGWGGASGGCIGILGL